MSGAKIVDIRTLKFRRTMSAENYKCRTKINADSQSGPIFCEKRADYIAFVDVDVRDHIGVVGFCEECSKKLKIRSPQSFSEISENK